MSFKRADKILAALAGALIAILFWGTANVAAVGVRPLVIDLEMRPGETQDFELVLSPAAEEETIDIVLYEPVQLLSGGLNYQVPDRLTFSPLSWVTLDSDQVVVYPGSEAKVKGSVTVPFSVGGSHTVILMVEPRIPPAEQGVSVQVRYAVRLNIRVDRPGLRQMADLEYFGIETTESGAPFVRALINNSSAWDYLVSGEVTIRDQERRLVERVVLKSPVAVTAGREATLLYPGAQVEFFGDITRPLNPGEYGLQVFFRYGDSGQILQRDVLTVDEGDFVFPGLDELGAFLVSPLTVEHELRAGVRKSQIFEFENLLGDPLRIELSLADVMPDYEYSALDWFELRGAQEFVLPARAKGRLAMTIAVPRDQADGGYYGRVQFRAFSTKTDELLSEILVPVGVVVGTDYGLDARIRSVSTASIEGEGTYFSIDLENSGDVSFLPVVEAVLTDEDGNYVRHLNLRPAEEAGPLLPLESLQLGTFGPDLEGGIYSLEIAVAQGGTVLKKEIHQVLVE